MNRAVNRYRLSGVWAYIMLENMIHISYSFCKRSKFGGKIKPYYDSEYEHSYTAQIRSHIIFHNMILPEYSNTIQGSVSIQTHIHTIFHACK